MMHTVPYFASFNLVVLFITRIPFPLFSFIHPLTLSHPYMLFTVQAYLISC
jgi:hypothetical protein